MTKKNMKIFIASLMVISFIIPLDGYKYQLEPVTQQTSSDTLIVGVRYLPFNLDPAQETIRYSTDVIEQVCEGLFTFDLSSPELEIIPRLASDFGTWNENLTEYTIPLRNDVNFHNGYEFNATVVKFTFDRIDHLLNLSLLNTDYLFERSDAVRLINRTVVMDQFTIKFVLNYPYPPFLSILCDSPTAIVEEHSIPWGSILNENGTLVGTGPYKYISRNEGDQEVRLEYNLNYYSELPEIENIIFRAYDNRELISQALLDGEIQFTIDFEAEFLDDFQTSNDLMVEAPQTKAHINIIGMNNVKLNTTLRRAISYAIDYDFIKSEIYENLRVKMTSIIPPGILYHKECRVPTFDLETARQFLINAGIAKGLNSDSPDSLWVAQSFEDPIKIVNFTFYTGDNGISETVGYSVAETLRLIGISVTIDGPYNWWEYSEKIDNNPENCDLFILNYMLDDRDPSSFINLLLSNSSEYNEFGVNDIWLEMMMNTSMYETVESKRRDMFYQIQDYVALNLMPFIGLGYYYLPGVHSYEIKNIPYNPIRKFEFYSRKWDNDTDGDGVLDSKEIDLYLTKLDDNDTDNDGLSDGQEIYTYFTDPKALDSDADGIPDGWEINQKLDPNYEDSGIDTDSDGLSNLEEYGFNTNVSDPDTDNDGLLDGEEILSGTDGYITDPNEADTDRDTFDDGEEAEWGTDPLDRTHFPNFWTKYDEIINRVGLAVASAIATGIIGVFFAKRKKKKDKTKKDEKKIERTVN